jgi:23S rRNA (pseudouridine1915-N3)-methyltransferase
VGRLRRGPLYDLQTDYAKRLVPPAAVIEVEEKRKLSPPELKQREADLLLAARPAGAMLVALDRSGQPWSSHDLADRLSAWRGRGTSAVAFTIGGAEGLGKAVLDTAEATLSLGAMTWPHLLVRTMLLEQLYRAQKILAGHPYHRD